jgi:hypothetical protein
MRHCVFEHLIEGTEAADHYFKHNEDAIDRLGLTGLQKAVAAIRILSYSLPADVVDSMCVLVSQLLVRLSIVSVGLSFLYLGSTTYVLQTQKM